ncbi:hypothetical protein QAD02_011335 [Eretmocerus hayati]|uniref:Uncharacterized protein n=1 Tax=Eretmocerus hayati TaxID=131215 RepID=A0ACC2NW96_9HYME|nr:hypothetical protein QAD02_011335 [Eretmocerus hayati]
MKGLEINDNDLEKSKSRVSNIMTMLCLLGCIPNADIARTIRHKSLMYALQPIKVGTPLIIYNASPTIYRSTPKLLRQIKHQMLYKVPCECRACTENWTEESMKSTDFCYASGVNLTALGLFMQEYESIMTEWETNVSPHKPSYPDLRIVTRANNLAREAWKHIPVQSAMAKIFADLTVCITNTFHNPDKNIFTTS